MRVRELGLLFTTGAGEELYLFFLANVMDKIQPQDLGTPGRGKGELYDNLQIALERCGT